MSWIVGVEWDPEGTVAHGRAAGRRGAVPPGRYFRATATPPTPSAGSPATSTTSPAPEHERGTSVPIAFANWPTTDPLAHPEEPLAEEDLVGVDAEHVLPTAAWPGGTFASFHAYPYYPDFQRDEPALQVAHDGPVDPYAAYLRALRDHFTSMPLMITEVGVPPRSARRTWARSAATRATTPSRRPCGSTPSCCAWSATRALAGGVRLPAGPTSGSSGPGTPSEHQVPERRQLWHDPLTNEQWFGVLATDGGEVPDGARELVPALRRAEVRAGARGRVVRRPRHHRPRRPPPRTSRSRWTRCRAGRPTTGSVVDRGAGTARAYVRSDLEPIRLYTRERIDYPEGPGARWHLYRQIMNRSFTVAGRHQDPELGDVGELVRGSWDPADPDYDSLATWQVDDQHDTVHLRVPWPMLGLADPSSRTALGPGNPARMVPIDGLGLTLRVDGSTNRLDYSWPRWNSLDHTERLVAGHEVLAGAFRDLAR